MSEELKQDANTATTSSVEATTDAKTSSEAAEAAQTVGAVKEATTIAEAVEQAGAANREPEEQKEEQAESTEKKTDEAADKEVQAETKEKDAEDKDALPPFHDHPRWKEVQQQLTELKPLAERARKLDSFVQSSGITETQFNEMLEIGRLMNADPVKALEKLRPYVESLETFQGLRLPADLQKKVDDGVIDPDTAREVAAMRAQKTHGTQRAEWQQQQTTFTNINNALVAWTESKSKTDPDFQKKYPLMLDRFRALTSQPHEQRPDVVIQLAEKALAEVESNLKGFLPPAVPKKVLTSNGASKTQKAEPKTMAEAIAAAGSKYREK